MNIGTGLVSVFYKKIWNKRNKFVPFKKKISTKFKIKNTSTNIPREKRRLKYATVKINHIKRKRISVQKFIYNYLALE